MYVYRRRQVRHCILFDEVMLDIRLQYHPIPQKFLVIRNLHHSSVIGMDFLQACKAVINLSEQTLRLFDNSFVAPLITAKDHANTLCLIHKVRIPGHREAVLQVTLARTHSIEVTTRRSLKRGLAS
jgi:hypothetical protein